MVNKFISRLKSFFGGKKKMPPKNEVIIDNWLERRRNATTTESMEWSSYQGKGTNAIKSTDTQAVTDKHEPQTAELLPRSVVEKLRRCRKSQQGRPISRSTIPEKFLSGKVYVHCIYAATTGWSPKSKDRVYACLCEAEEWLKKEVGRYNGHIDFKNGMSGYEENIDLMVHGYSKFADSHAAEKALKLIGHENIDSFSNWARETHGCDHCIIILFTRCPGRSYASGQEYKIGNRYYNGHCVCCVKSRNGYPLYASSVAHEILHCFGAKDLYQTGNKPAEVVELAEKMYSGEIMINTKSNINENHISEFTAWCVGLSDAWKEEFRIFLKKK